MAKTNRLWFEWDESGREPERFKALAASFDTTLQGIAERLAREAKMPVSIVRCEVDKAFVEAAKSFHIGRHVSFETWLYYALRITVGVIKKYSLSGEKPDGQVAGPQTR